jgi:RHS repeat-associated protein
MRGGILIVVSAIHGVVGYFTRKIREILLGKPYVIKYSYMGLRTYRKDNAGVITNYYWSLSSLPQVINETDGSGNSKASYILGTGVIAIKVSGVKKYYITDALGSVLALTDSSGNVTDKYEYGPFGELMSSTGTSYNPYRFTGQQWDEDSGLYYLRARYYEPSTGRFTQRDPIFIIAERLQIFNRYAYVNNSPTVYTDPYGLIPQINVQQIFVGSINVSVTDTQYHMISAIIVIHIFNQLKQREQVEIVGSIGAWAPGRPAYFSFKQCPGQYHVKAEALIYVMAPSAYHVTVPGYAGFIDVW